MLIFFFFFFKQKTAYEMLRSLVGSEMCIRDRVSTQSTGSQTVAMAEEPTEMDQAEPQVKEENVPPCQTLYLNNLNERVKGEALKTALQAVFKQFGTVVEIVAMDSVRRRGQAFVVFDDLASAVEAKESMQGFPFFDKPMRIQFAKSKSDVIAKREGLTPPTAEERKAERSKLWEEEKKNPKVKKPKAEDPKTDKNGVPIGYGGEAPVALRPAVEKPMPLDMQTPNKTLFVQNLPDEVNEMSIIQLFQQCEGFERVRMVPGRMGICFVDFEIESQAGTAMHYVQGYQLTPEHALVISFAKK
eukprot:TRINITY_DN575_c0_g1_i2.p1 TRINITY_DN575_c0_g1~~TRINITY_DN575_c0_g1_i2.p1  ORF type:complete len:301 (-),score=110.26 TRINITY_DN575_c0_g1_i2:324-1226(-)